MTITTTMTVGMMIGTTAMTVTMIGMTAMMTGTTAMTIGTTAMIAAAGIATTTTIEPPMGGPLHTPVLPGCRSWARMAGEGGGTR